MEDIAVYGAGGFGQEVACLINAINEVKKEWNFIGFFDDGLPIGFKTFGYEVIGGIDKLNAYDKSLHLVIAIGNPQIMKNISNKIDNPNIEFPNLIAPNVFFYNKSKLILGKGNIITFYCIISMDVNIGNFNLFNCKVCLGHDVAVGNFNVFNPSVQISGNVQIGDANFFGISSIVLQVKKIGSNTNIGANSLIMRNTKDNNLYFGNPAILIKL